MINRALLRIKVLQILYAFHVKGTTDLVVAENELKMSAKKSYDLYYSTLLLMVELKRYAEGRLELQKTRDALVGLKSTINTRFIDNKFIAFLEESSYFWSYIGENSISWDENPELIKSLYNSITASEYFDSYMYGDEPSIADDKSLWRKILKTEFYNNEDLSSALEETSIYWLDEVDLIFSFVEKSIKLFDENVEDNVLFLPMYKSEDDYVFANKLLNAAIVNSEKYDEILRKYLVNWELERVNFLDVLIIKLAISELNDFDSIPVNVTLNVYIDLAKMYSTPKSGRFVNGILDKLVHDMRQNHSMHKVNEI